jgi:hypothetical protein
MAGDSKKMDRATPTAGVLATEPNGAPWSEAEQFPVAMQIADKIRQYDKEQLIESADSMPKDPVTGDSSVVDPLAPMRKLLEVPGVVPGCIATVFGIALMIPARRTLLRVCDKYWNLGTAFPDLIVTPMLTIYVAQCSLWVGSLFGSSFYLNKLASFPVEAPSHTVDTICNDPTIINAFLRLPPPSKVPFSQEQTPGMSLSSSFRQWDPREKLLSNLQDAVRSCQRRREYFKKNGKTVSRQ